MTRDELLDAWAPTGGVWSDWAKPVLFAHWPRPVSAVADAPPIDLAWVPPATERVALLIDLPGPASVHVGLALAGAGYRPVPLFNAVPPPAEGDPSAAVVPVEPILAALAHGADQLRAAALPADAPPAFLLDSDRQTALRDVSPGAFDNRSVVFATDFPSATRLAAQGVTRAVLVRERPGPIGDDLEDALRAWHIDGLRLEVTWLSESGPPLPLTLPSRGWWARLWHQLTRTYPRRNPAGEFGRFIPHPSAG